MSLFVHVLEVKVIGWFSDQSGTAIHVGYSRALNLTAAIRVLTSMCAGLKMPQCLVQYLQFGKGTCMDWNLLIELERCPANSKHKG